MELGAFEVGNFDKKTDFSAITTIFSPLVNARGTRMSLNATLNQEIFYDIFQIYSNPFPQLLIKCENSIKIQIFTKINKRASTPRFFICAAQMSLHCVIFDKCTKIGPESPDYLFQDVFGD